MFTALLDTNVLWPSLLRDFLLSLAIEGLYRPVWSETILAELEYHEAAKLVGRGMARTEADLRSAWLVAQMREHFDDALVTGWEGLDGTYGLPDPDDEHVLAAAVVGAAGVIVTYNVKDFPASKVPAGIDVLAPEVFAHTTVSLDRRRLPSRRFLTAPMASQPQKIAVGSRSTSARRSSTRGVGSMRS